MRLRTGLLPHTHTHPKFLFCHYYQRPPLYDESIGKHYGGMIPWAIILHLLVTVWMYGRPTIFQEYKCSDSNYLCEITDTLQTATGLKNLLEDQLGQASSHTFFHTGLSVVFKPHTLPLFTLACLLLAFKILGFVVSVFGHTLAKIWTLCTCGKCHHEEVHEYHPPYDEALRDGKIRGVKDYNGEGGVGGGEREGRTDGRK